MAVVKYTGIGALAGGVLAVLLYALGFGVEILNCACAIITCDCNREEALPGLWHGNSFVNIFLFCLIGGAIIGLVYGIYKRKMELDAEAARKAAENSEEARRQRELWAEEIRNEANAIYKTCKTNQDADKPLRSTTHKSSELMKEIVEELTRASELQGRVDAIANEVSLRGDTK